MLEMIDYSTFLNHDIPTFACDRSSKAPVVRMVGRLRERVHSRGWMMHLQALPRFSSSRANPCWLPARGRIRRLAVGSIKQDEALVSFTRQHSAAKLEVHVKVSLPSSDGSEEGRHECAIH